MGFGGIGASELVVILLIALLIFGPARLAEIGSSLGKAVRDFRRAMQDDVHKDA
ncbi:MAG: twin-arginine translocase TatA/TatE family subunit [candidate division GAL15 bacterium]